MTTLECTCKERGLMCVCGCGESVAPGFECSHLHNGPFFNRGEFQKKPHRGDCPKSMKQIKKRRKKAKALKEQG